MEATPLAVYLFIATTIMLRASILGRALILAGAVQGQLIFGLGNLAAGYSFVQSPLADGYNATCERIAMSISPASQVFYPGELSSRLISSAAFSRRRH